MTALFHVKGSDVVLRDRVLDALVDELLAGEDRSFALEEFTVPKGRGSVRDDGETEVVVVGADATADDRASIVAAIVNAASSPPFMTATRVVVVRDAGALTAADVAPLSAYLEAPLDTTVLVFVDGGGTFPAALAKVLGAHGVIDRKPESEKTEDVLLATAHDAGVLLTGDAARLIKDHLADDAGRVVSLVDVLANAAEPGARLGVEDVEPYLGEEGSIPTFALTNAIEAGDSPGALEALHRLLTVTSGEQARPAHPLQLMGTLLAFYRRVLRLDDPTIRNPADAVAALGGRIKEYPARKALGAARALGTDGIREAFDALARADLDLKGARGMPADAVMEVLVVRLARLNARAGLGRGSRTSGGGGGGRRRASR